MAAGSKNASDLVQEFGERRGEGRRGEKSHHSVDAVIIDPIEVFH
jgi:hypothetical protein